MGRSGADTAATVSEKKVPGGDFGALLRKHFRKIGLGRLLALVFLAALLALRQWDPVPLQTLRLKIFDFYQVLKPREITPQPIAIVDIDEESLAVVGQWPWPRTIVADLVTQIMAGGAVAVAFDIVFAEPDRMSPANIAREIRGLDEADRARLRSLPDNDAVLASAIRQARVVVGEAGYPRALGDSTRPVASVPVATLGGDPRDSLFEFKGLIRNLPVLEEAAAGRGVFSLTPEQDGIVRRVPVMIRVGDALLPTLALELLRVATGQTTYALKRDRAGITSIVMAGNEIPTDRLGRVWVYFSKHDKNKYVSAKDVLAATAPSESLAGKLVLIGTSATGLLDIKATPVQSALPGVEVHAQFLENILSNSYLVRPGYALGAEWSMTALIAVAMILLVPILGALWTLVLGAGIAATVAGGSWYFFVEQGILIDVSYALAVSFAIYALLVFESYFREESQKRRVRGAFGQYLSPALVKQLAEDPDKLVLGGETKVMTFLFCDIHGFTTISERYKDDPQKLTRLINSFLTPLTDAILESGGTIDKYMGDCIMAMWNAPLTDEEHAVHACEAALSMLDRLARLNELRAREAEADGHDFIELRVGIGVNTGTCTVGNMGSEQRFDYSVLGDSVNLASRLEGQSRNYTVSILIGEETAASARDRFALLELDLIAVKGKSEPTRVFTLLGKESLARDPAFEALAAMNQELLDHYRRQDWERAGQAAEACRNMDPGLELEGLYRMHERRIEAYSAAPPGPEWRGVTVAETK